MKDIVDWFNRSVEEETQHPLILIGIFIVVLLAIHPFKDGNGRLSRVLTTLLLLRAGYGYVPYSSMESVIERNKDSYYLVLRRTQQTIRKEEQNWEPWLVFFLKTMAKQKDNLAAKLKEEQALRASLPALSRQILELVKTRGEITVKEIEDSTGANRNTIKVHVKKLAKQNYLVAGWQGTRRAVHDQMTGHFALVTFPIAKKASRASCGRSGSDLEMHQRWVTSELTPMKQYGLRKNIFAIYDIFCHV